MTLDNRKREREKEDNDDGDVLLREGSMIFAAAVMSSSLKGREGNVF